MLSTFWRELFRVMRVCGQQVLCTEVLFIHPPNPRRSLFLPVSSSPAAELSACPDGSVGVSPLTSSLVSRDSHSIQGHPELSWLVGWLALYLSHWWAPVLPPGRTQNEAVCLAHTSGTQAACVGPVSLPDHGACWDEAAMAVPGPGDASQDGGKADVDQPVWLPARLPTCTLLCARPHLCL